MVFFLSFIPRNFIFGIYMYFGSTKKKKFFGFFGFFLAAILEKKGQIYARARSNERSAFNLFPITQLFGMVNHDYISQDVFFHFLEKIKIENFEGVQNFFKKKARFLQKKFPGIRVYEG